MASNIKNFGKIRYIEPNDILADKIYNKSTSTGTFNIPYPYEDYSISVDLIVTNPERIKCGNIENSEIKVYSNNLDNNTEKQKISFFSYNNEYLTDTPGTTIYKDILNNKKTQENLGITDIHISYNSYFYPRVTIKFTDIKGGALMMPHEENYSREQNKFSNAVSNFFTSLFSFPYPEFTLRVKGFYGKKVDFSLVVEEFKSSFNNQTGNFDATVKFIGKMFSVYTDIPMSYLLIAPYCRYGSFNNQTIWEQENFTFDDGIKIPTFIELEQKIATIETNIENTLNSDLKNQSQNLSNNKTLLENITNAYNDIFVFFNENKNDFISFLNENIILYKNDKINGNNLTIFNNKIKTLCELIEKFNNENGSFKLPYPKPFNKQNKNINSNNKIYFNKSEEKIIINKSKSNQDLIFNLGNYFNLAECINTYFTNNKLIFDTFNIINSEEFNLKLGEIKSKLNEVSGEIYKKIEEDANIKIEGLLEFKPSIRNIFMILMAHLSCFIKIYKKFLDNIEDAEERKLKKLGINLNNTDINLKGNNSDNVILPAFPAFIDNEKKLVYPNRQILNDNIEETYLIDSLLDGSYSFLKEVDTLEKSKEELSDSSLSFIPTCLTDLINYINPYDEILNSNNNSENEIGIIFTFFGARCISKYFLEQSTTLSPQEFGKTEAFNFWRTNQSLRQNIINQISNAEFNSDNFLYYLAGEKNTYLNNAPYYSDNSNTKKLIDSYRKGNVKTYISNNFNFPAIIGRLEEGSSFIETFKKDYSDTTCTVSFKKQENESITKNNRPNGFINFIEIENLNKINTDLNALDTSELCDKFKLVGAHLSNTKDIVDNNDNNNSGIEIYFSENTEDSNKIMIIYNNLHDYTINDSGYVKFKEVYESNTFGEKKIKTIIKRDGTYGRKPFFGIEEGKDITAEDLLLSVKHNIPEIVMKFKEGKTVITIPYITKLFIGMLIYNLKNNYENFLKIFDKINKGDSVYCLLCMFMRKEDGTYNENCFKDTFHGGKDTIFKEEDILKPWFDIDYYNLSNEYNAWNISNSPGGFLYLKNHYSFNLKDLKYVIDNVKYSSDDKGKIDINNSDVIGLINENIRLTEGYGNFYEKYSVIKCAENRKNYYTIFNEEDECYKHLENLFSKTYKFVIPYQMKPYELENNKIYIETDKLKASFTSFKETLLKLYNVETEKKQDNDTTTNLSSYNTPIDNKLSMYKTLKNLQDKHFYELSNSNFADKFNLKSKFDKIDTEFDRFHFIDSFFNDIGDEINFNLDAVTNIFTNIIEGGENKVDNIISGDMSVFSFMAKICEDHNMMLMAMPIFNGSFVNENGSNNFVDMFTPFPYNKTINENTMSGPSYICYYPDQPSQYLDNPNSQYKNDGFNIIQDINDTGNFEGPIDVPDLAKSDGKYIIPAFSVEYGSQKQSIFKSINVNMDNPQTTEVAVAIQFGIANRNNETPQKVSFQGQDLYKIYSNYSYTCDVEMMGCAQIQPLMYFQLNNIPMFRGAYIIISVEHRITPGDMTTTFRGVRINKNKIPRVKSCISNKNMIDLINKENNIISSKAIIKPIQMVELENSKSRVHFMETERNISFNDIIKDYSEYFTYGSNQKENFNLLNPYLRLLVYNILGDLKELSKELPYKLGLKLTSSARITHSKRSDHYIGEDGTPSEKRKQLKGTDAYGNEKPYNQLGCAIDIFGTKNGVTDKGESSIILFNLIAKNYQEYIRQLIWEIDDSGGNSPKSDIISNVIHLGSYGKDNDKRMIFMALKSTGYNIYENKTNISNEYLKILKEVLNNKIEKNICIYPNFSKEEINEYIV